jgi:hypothetical protein
VGRAVLFEKHVADKFERILQGLPILGSIYDYLFSQTIFALCMTVCVSVGRDVHLTSRGNQHVARMGERGARWRNG